MNLQNNPITYQTERQVVTFLLINFAIKTTMKNKDCISRCLYIVRRLKHRQKVSFLEIQNYLKSLSDLTGNDYNISIRTFQRDLEAIRELFLIDIKYSRIEGLYYINDEFTDEKLSERILESFEVFHSLKLMDSLSGVFHLESRSPLGTEHLSKMIYAIKNKKTVALTYNKNWENQFTERTILPLLLKEFRGRWYVVGKRMDTNEVRTYSLDRIVEFSVQDRCAISHTEDVKNYFHYSFGIYGRMDPNPQEVVLRFTPEAGKYIKDAVLHHSQEVLSDNTEAFIIKLHLLITFDFVMEILGYAEHVEVVSPQTLREDVCGRLKKAIEKYK